MGLAHNHDNQDWPILSYIEYYILVALHKSPLHGLGITAEVARRTSNRLFLIPGSLYPALSRLYDRDWIEQVQPPKKGVDTRRKYFQLTESGQNKLEEYRHWMKEEVQAQID
jgi:DNA-binding PadR family transcriptional regulator